jgi:hypothetical protein
MGTKNPPSGVIRNIIPKMHGKCKGFTRPCAKYYNLAKEAYPCRK